MHTMATALRMAVKLSASNVLSSLANFACVWQHMSIYTQWCALTEAHLHVFQQKHEVAVLHIGAVQLDDIPVVAQCLQNPQLLQE